ncbi:Uncharacterised protein [Chromobacterium violaceum]|nr:Uncharacterised protein [Chromobacterium violaceum]
MYTVGLPNAAPASVRVICTELISAPSVWTTRMPRPPPPPAALMMTGKPIFLAILTISAGSSGSAPSEPGTQGTPASIIACLADTLSPIMRMVSGRGPMNTKPDCSTRSAKSAFSDRKP